VIARAAHWLLFSSGDVCEAIKLLTTKDCERLAEDIIENIDGASAFLKTIANDKQIIILC